MALARAPLVMAMPPLAAMALARAPLVMAMPPLAAVKLYVGASAMRSASAAMRVYAVELPRLLLARMMLFFG